MTETPQQYTQRILGHVEGKDPLEVQAATPGKLERVIKDVPTTKLRERPAAGKWSVSEIVAHFDDAERGQETIEHVVRMTAGHDINHLRQIERILPAKQK
jgi:hypothetical protein